MSETQTTMDEFESLLARAETIEKAVPAGQPVNNQLPNQTPSAAKFDVDKVRRSLSSEFDEGTFNRAFAPLVNAVEESQKLVSGLQKELQARDEAAYANKLIEWAHKTGDPRYGSPGQPLTAEQEAAIASLHKVASVMLADSVQAAKADTTGKTKAKSWDEAMSAAQSARGGKSDAVRAIQQSVQGRHNARTFTPTAAGSGNNGGGASPREEGIAAIRAIVGR